MCYNQQVNNLLREDCFRENKKQSIQFVNSSSNSILCC